jgi:hypothetical protein
MESSTKSVQIYLICKTKKSSKYFIIILNTMGSNNIMKIVHFEYELGHQNKSTSVCQTFFVDLFTPYLIEKIQDFIIYVRRDTCEIKKICKHFDTPCIILIDFEKFITTFSCFYFYYYKGRCYSIIYHLKARHEYSKMI